MKNIHYLLAGFLLTIGVGAFAAKITDDEVKLCVPGTADACFIIFDTNDGVGNVSIEANSGELKINNGPLTDSQITDTDIDLGTATNTSRLTVGKGTSAALSALTRKEGTIQYDTDQDNLVFDDGLDLRPVGSGTGGSQGINLVDNSTFDINANSWTQSGGTLTRVTSPVGNGSGSLQWAPTTSAETLLPDAKVIPAVLNDRPCLLQFQYRYVGGADGDITVKVVNGGTDLTTPVNLVLTPGTSEWKPVNIAFSCPTGSSPRAHFETVSATPQPLFIDDVHTGTDFRIGQTQGVTLTSWTSYTPSGSLTGVTATLGDFSYSHQGKDLLISGNVEFTGAASSNVRYPIGNLLPPGFTFDAVGSWSNLALQIPFNAWNFVDLSASSTADHFSGHTVVDFNSAYVGFWTGDQDEFDAATPVGSASGDRLGFTVRIPVLEGNTSDQTVTLETQGWYFDGNIGGANDQLSNSDQSTYVGLTHSDLDLVLKPGSASCKIACATGTASTGLTCSSDEAIGVSCNIPKSGTYKFCGEFAWQAATTAGSAYSTTFQWVETSDLSETILQEGGSRINVRMDTDSVINHLPLNLCGTFSFSSAGQKTIRLMYETDVTGAPTAQTLAMDRLAALGQRDMHVTMYPLTQNFPQAVALTGLEVSGESKVSSQSGYGSTGTTTVRFTTDEFSSGDSITYNSDAINGDSWTINQDGVYSFHARVRLNSAPASFFMAVTKNRASNASPGNSTADEIGCSATWVNSTHGGCSGTRRLSAGDVVRVQVDSAPALNTSTFNYVGMTIVQVSR